MLLELSPIVTSAVGCVLSTTVNVAVPPASVVVSGPGGVTVIPAVSLSVLVTSDVGRVARRCSSASVLTAGAVTIV